MWFVFGSLAMLAAGCFVVFTRQARAEFHAMLATETLPVPQLEELRRTSDRQGARGGFRRVAEVAGVAKPGPGGALTAELSKAPCVWYRWEVLREYRNVEYRRGRYRNSRRVEPVASFESKSSYALVDPTGWAIGVDPRGREPEFVEQVVDRHEPHTAVSQFADLLGRVLPRHPFENLTLGFVYREWIIRPGTPLYVLGEVHDVHGPLVIARPQGEGHFIISTRSEPEIRARRVRQYRNSRTFVLVMFFAGLAMTIIGFFA